MRIFGCALQPLSGGGADATRRTFAIATEAGSVEIWSDSIDHKELVAREPEAHGPDEALRVAWNRDGTRLLSGGGNAVLNLFDSELKRQARIALPADNPEDQAVYACWFARFDPKRIVAGYENKVSTYDVETNARVSVINFSSSEALKSARNEHGTRLVFDACEAPDQVLFAAALSDGCLSLTDPRASTAPAMTQVHAGVCTSCRFSPSGQRLVTASSDGTASVWDVRKMDAALHTMNHGEGRIVYGACFAPHDEQLVVTWSEMEAIVWKAENALVSNALDFSVLCLDCDSGRVILCGEMADEEEDEEGEHDHGHTHAHGHSDHGHSHGDDDHGHTHAQGHSDHHGHAHGDDGQSKLMRLGADDDNHHGHAHHQHGPSHGGAPCHGHSHGADDERDDEDSNGEDESEVEDRHGHGHSHGGVPCHGHSHGEEEEDSEEDEASETHEDDHAHGHSHGGVPCHGHSHGEGESDDDEDDGDMTDVMYSSAASVFWS